MRDLLNSVSVPCRDANLNQAIPLDAALASESTVLLETRRLFDAILNTQGWLYASGRVVVGEPSHVALGYALDMALVVSLTLAMVVYLGVTERLFRAFAAPAQGICTKQGCALRMRACALPYAQSSPLQGGWRETHLRNKMYTRAQK